MGESSRLLPHRVAGWTLLLFLLAASAAVLPPACALREARFEPERLESLPPEEFSRLVRDFSEEGGYFRSDNFTSNETSYLHVVGKLRELGVSAGAYVGVGPEQNFTYIAKVRPRIAFIVDIRRQAMLQHLLYKAVFHVSETRADFLSRLLSRPLSARTAPREGPPERLVEYFGSAAADEAAFKANLAASLKTIQEDFNVPLSDGDREKLAYVYSAFQKDGLDISYWSVGTGRGFGYRRFPNLGELILQQDLAGSLGNFLASEEDYRFVRGLHLQNRIIPIVGDFAGSKALASVGEYLRTNGYAVSAFYTSNVEQFLFQNEVFGAFVANVRSLPIDERSVIIRAIPARGETHPAQVPGHRTATVLQKIAVFLEDYDAGALTDYRTLVTTHFIAGQ
jgi:hypothetical protein